jgi:serine/threonine protein kinase
MSCEGDYSFSELGSELGSKPGSKRRFSSGSGSGSGSSSKKGKCESPNSKLSGFQNEKIHIKEFIKLYIFVKLLGCGAFGTVNLMQNRLTEMHYAVKFIEKTDPHTDDKTLNEIKLGMILDSPFICKVHCYAEDNQHFYIIMDYIEGMDLCDFIRKYPTFFIQNHQSFWVVVKSILRGLAYLHSKGIAHMDIKPENVFLLFDNEGNIFDVKLIDLGLSMVVNDADTKCFRGTDIYMAPEFFHTFSNIDCKVDIWSIGITVFVMIKASLPTEIVSCKKDPKRRQDEIYQKIKRLQMNEPFNPFGKKTSEDQNIAKMESFIRSCLITDPTNRPTADELLGDIPLTSTIS